MTADRIALIAVLDHAETLERQIVDLIRQADRYRTENRDLHRSLNRVRRAAESCCDEAPMPFVDINKGKHVG